MVQVGSVWWITWYRWGQDIEYNVQITDYETLVICSSASTFLNI